MMEPEFSIGADFKFLKDGITLLRGKRNILRELLFQMFARAQRSLGILKSIFINVGNAGDEETAKLNI